MSVVSGSRSTPLSTQRIVQPLAWVYHYDIYMRNSNVATKEKPKRKATKKAKAKALAKAATSQNKHDDGLNAREEMFCQLFATDREFFCNGVQSYIEAYDVEPAKYKSASVLASRLLGKAKIQKRINELVELGELNDTFVDKQLAKVIVQDVHLPAKVQGIREYNTLKKRTTTTTVEHRFGDLADLTDEELKARKREAMKALNMELPA